MYRLPLFWLGLAFSPYVACSCFGEDARQGFDVAVTASSTSKGPGSVLLQTPRSIVHATSITFKNGRDRITITAHDNELHLRFGAIVICTSELRLPGTLQIEDLQIQKLDLKPKGHSQ